MLSLNWVLSFCIQGSKMHPGSVRVFPCHLLVGIARSVFWRKLSLLNVGEILTSS